MVGLIYISVIIFTFYLVVGYFYLGIPRSISQTYYLLPKSKRWIFAAIQVGFSLPLILTFQSHLLTMAGTFIIFSALSADTRSDDDEEWFYDLSTVHVIGATGGIILAMATMIQFGLWWIPAVQIAFTIPAMKIPIKNHTTYIEMLAFYLTCLGVILHIS